MRDRALTSLRKASTILSVALAVSLLGNAAYGQSLRRSPVKLGAPKQLGRVRASSSEEARETDQRLGRIVWVEGGLAGVVSQPYNSYANWDSFYYACDARMNAVAVLGNTGRTHRSSHIFAINDGSVQRGDWVFIKQIPPRAEPEDAASDEEDLSES